MLRAINPQTPWGNVGPVTGQCPCFSGPQPRLRVLKDRKERERCHRQLSDSPCFLKTGLLWVWQDGVTHREAETEMEARREED